MMQNISNKGQMRKERKKCRQNISEKEKKSRERKKDRHTDIQTNRQIYGQTG